MKTVDHSNNFNTSQEIIALLKMHSTTLENTTDLDPLMDRIGNAKYVLLGEASHGTHEYYSWRAKITQRLIQEKGFSFVAVEGDWPDCYRLNRFAKGYSDSTKDLYSIMDEFKRWPTWMWANWETTAFIDWLKVFNENLPPDQKIGFYGLDLYSIKESMNAIIPFLEENDPSTVVLAKNILKCFERYSKDNGQSYAKASSVVHELCEKEILDLLNAIRKNGPTYNHDPENALSTEQNAFLASNAEKHYRAMIKRGPTSWNIRDQYMVSTIERLLKFHGDTAKVIVWAHNSHIGDARATDMVTQGKVSVGQLLREHYADQGVVSVGFGSYQGSVIAGRSWGDSMRKIKVPEAVEGSWEQLFHLASKGENNLLIMNHLSSEECMSYHIDHRAIGLVYNPEQDRFENYTLSILPKRYDAFIFLDKTTAAHPLNIQPDNKQTPETYPFCI